VRHDRVKVGDRYVRRTLQAAVQMVDSLHEARELWAGMRRGAGG
jgi:hypothetical protein